MTLKGIKPGELLEAHPASTEVPMAAPHRHFCRHCAKALWNFTPQQPKQRGLSVRAALRSSSDAARYIGPIGAGSVSNGTGENLFLHEGDILVGARIGMAWDQSKPRLLDPRSIA